MLLSSHTPETLYAALLARDPAFNGHAYVCVTTTGIFCRLTCPARKPKFENTRFFTSIAECAAAGFRPCQRCQPLNYLTSRDDITAALLAALNSQPEKPWSEDDLIAMGYDPSTIRRAFKRNFGMTFLELARLRRASLGLDTLAAGAPVIEAQLDAGYASASGFREAITRLLANTPSALAGRPLLHGAWLDTPIGQMLAIADSTRLHLLEFYDRKGLPAELKRLTARTGSAVTFSRNQLIDRIETELTDYFSGKLRHFTTPIARDHTEFTKTVWQALTTIAYGTTTSYGALAETLGHPTAARAVARANGANQLALLIPCHRVIGADGALTGYGGQLWRKQWLLEHERKHTPQHA